MNSKCCRKVKNQEAFNAVRGVRPGPWISFSVFRLRLGWSLPPQVYYLFDERVPGREGLHETVYGCNDKEMRVIDESYKDVEDAAHVEMQAAYDREQSGVIADGQKESKSVQEIS